MSNRSYSTRFARQLQDKLGPAFTVEDLGGGLLVAAHRDGGSISGHLPAVDRRKPVSDLAVDRWIEYGTARLRRLMPSYTEAAQAEARALLADLPQKEA